jgi:hypothetical protein
MFKEVYLDESVLTLKYQWFIRLQCISILRQLLGMILMRLHESVTHKHCDLSSIHHPMLESAFGHFRVLVEILCSDQSHHALYSATPDVEYYFVSAGLLVQIPAAAHSSNKISWLLLDD